MRKRRLVAWTLFVATAIPPGLAAAEGSILGIVEGLDRLELFATPTAEAPALSVGRSELQLPTPILERSDYGMVKLKHGGAGYWVITDDVRTDMSRTVDTACDPKLGGTLAAHGKRGAGEGCK